VAEIVVEFSWSEYEIDDNLSRLRWIPTVATEKGYRASIVNHYHAVSYACLALDAFSFSTMCVIVCAHRE
jgi:hypothetical protein